MTTPVAANTSSTARLMAEAPTYAVGWQERLYLPVPAAGAPWVYTLDGRWYERLVMARWTYNSSAAVANRIMTHRLSDANGVVLFEAAASKIITASQTLITNAAIRQTYYDAGSTLLMGSWLPDIVVPPGWSWTGYASNADVADQITGVTLVVQRFPSDTAAITAGQ